MGQHKVTVQVKRIGGGFGGKERAAALIALPTAAIAKWLAPSIASLNSIVLLCLA